ncbi:MAG: collagen-like protein, partial [Oscillospiraceae bacterium]|nr:collagen-like protein [Oscillospiraceae bacterium]
MSQPTFPQIDPPLTREGSLNEILSSIAMEELSLSHILNAEGEKLQYVLGTLPGLDETAALEEVLQVNQSVKDTLSSVMEQQMALTAKLSAAMKAPPPPRPARRGGGGGG